MYYEYLVLLLVSGCPVVSCKESRRVLRWLLVWISSVSITRRVGSLVNFGVVFEYVTMGLYIVATRWLLPMSPCPLPCGIHVKNDPKSCIHT